MSLSLSLPLSTKSEDSNSDVLVLGSYRLLSDAIHLQKYQLSIRLVFGKASPGLWILVHVALIMPQALGWLCVHGQLASSSLGGGGGGWTRSSKY